MKIKTAFLFFVILAQSVIVGSGIAYSFQVKVIPKKIYQGDAFVIKVTGTKHSEAPVASMDGKQFVFSKCGEDCFIAIGAVDLEIKPGRKKIKLALRNQKKNLSLIVKRGKFPSMSLTLPEEKVSPGAEDMKIIENENERLKELWGKETERMWEGNFIRPVENGASTAFGTKRILNEERISIHKGTDFRAEEGEEVKASNSGKVVLAEELFFGGNTVILDHGSGIFTVYMHLSAFKIQNRDIVSKGDVIGLAGSTGRASGPHLHFGIKVSGVNANPVSLFSLKL
jgi:murein DD-endopeptidase MepM/ murein hydrolase activator NlpD